MALTHGIFELKTDHYWERGEENRAQETRIPFIYHTTTNFHTYCCFWSSTVLESDIESALSVLWHCDSFSSTVTLSLLFSSQTEIDMTTTFLLEHFMDCFFHVCSKIENQSQLCKLQNHSVFYWITRYSSSDEMSLCLSIFWWIWKMGSSFFQRKMRCKHSATEQLPPAVSLG